MVTATDLLSIAGFSDDFCRIFQSKFPAMPSEEGFMATIDNGNLLRAVLEDFVGSTVRPQSLAYTNLALDSIRTEDKIKEPGDRKTVTVGPGIHEHKNGLIFCYETADESQLLHSGTLKYMNRAALVSRQSMDQIRAYLKHVSAERAGDPSLALFVCDNMEWVLRSVPKRPDSTIFSEHWSGLLAECKDFFAPETKAFYAAHGISHMRNYLLWGEPGNGKSGTIKAIASALDRNLYWLNLGTARMDDMSLLSMVNAIESGSIVAIEDVDRLFDNFQANQSASAVSFSMLLNVLDGTVAREGCILFLTCNDRSGLDEAFLRAGRIDRQLEFKNASRAQVKAMFKAFYPTSTRQEVASFVRETSAHFPLSMATVQEYFVRSRGRAVRSNTEAFFRARRKRRRTMHG